jgi:nitrate reductase NapE component
MTELILVGAFSLLIGFVSAYGFDTWLQWRDDRKWR